MTNQVRHFRKLAGLTQQEVADRLGIHVTNYNKIERGRSSPDVSRFAQIATILGTTVPELLAAPLGEPRRLSEHDEYLEEQAVHGSSQPRAYHLDSFRPSTPGALPEIDVQVGAGEGAIGEVVSLPLGGEAYSGHRIIGEWLFPESYLRSEIHASASKTLVMPVVGDSMIPTYQPGDRVLVDTTQNSHSSDTVYVISDGESPPQIKRLQRVLFSKPTEVRIISDNPANENVTVALADVRIIGRVVGVVSRR